MADTPAWIRGTMTRLAAKTARLARTTPRVAARPTASGEEPAVKARPAGGQAHHQAEDRRLERRGNDVREPEKHQ